MLKTLFSAWPRRDWFIKGHDASRKIMASAISCVIEPMESRLLLAGNGLSATYWDNASATYGSSLNFSGPAVSRIDPSVNFNWGYGSPASKIGSNTFSARWTGQIAISTTATYTFYAKTDDGVRLWVNGTLLINNWRNQAAQERSASIALTGGRRYDVRMEYFENAGNAVAQLRWSSPGISKSIIPQNVLYSTSIPAAPSGLSVTAISSSAAQLTWTDNASNEDGFAILRSTDGLAFATIGTVTANTKTYSDTGLAAGTKYYYSVYAYNVAGNSASATGTVVTQTGAPTNLVATPAANVPKVNLTWTGGSLDNLGYVIERSSDGAIFSEIARVGAGVTNYSDAAGLAGGSNYTYRVRAIEAAGTSAPSQAAVATTAGFHVFDSTYFTGEPDLSSYGIQNIYVTDREYLAGSWPNYDHSAPNEAAARALADKVVTAGQNLVIDEEVWRIDLTVVAPSVALANLQKLNQLVDWVRSEQPGIRLGFFDLLPAARPTGTDPTSVQFNAQLDALMSKVTYYFPCYYMHAAAGEDVVNWQERVNESLAEIKSVAGGKPVYPFVWMKKDDGITPVSGDQWRTELDTLRRNADGVVIWGGWNFAADGTLLGREAWDSSAAWWQGTSDFVEAMPAAQLTPPTGLSAQSLPGNVRLTWQATSGDALIAIERSVDGITFTLIAIVGAESTSFDDTGIDGSLYQYRLKTTNGATNSAPGGPVAVQSTRDALQAIQAESANAYQSNNMTFSKTLLINPANDWVKYSSVDFGAGASRFTARVTVGITQPTQQIELRLDGVDGPIIGVFTPSSTGGINTFADETASVSGASGVHDLYLVTKGWGVSYMDWVRFSQ